MRDILEILLSIPTVDLNITDSDGRNIAQIAVEKDDIEEYDLQCLELLANDARVNWNIKNADGETPIMYTMRERKEEMFQILKRTVSVIDNPDFLQDCFNAGKVSVPECPVCYSSYSPASHVYLCTEGHWVCGDCRLRLERCSLCRSPIVGRAHDFEKFLQTLTI